MKKGIKKNSDFVHPMLKFIAQEMNRQTEAKRESDKEIWHDVGLILEAMTDQPPEKPPNKRSWFDRQWSSTERYQAPLFAINHFNDLAKKNPVTLQVNVSKTKSGQLIINPTHKGDTLTATMLALLWEYYFQNKGYDRLKRCPKCKKWFVDETRNKSQIYCSHHCGNLYWNRAQRREAGHKGQVPQKL